MAGILGGNLIDGHHLGMIDGDIICTMVGIITDGDTITGWATLIMAGTADMDTTVGSTVGIEVQT